MSDSSPPSPKNKPAGFDQPTGPFARRDTGASYNPFSDDSVPSYADQSDEDGSDHQANDRSQERGHDHYGSAEDTAKVAALQGELADMKEQALRAMAEVENIRRRSVKEREDASRYAVSSFAKDLLDVADTFRRAIDSVPAEMREADPRVVSLLDGIEATERKMLGMFGRHGIKKLEPVDEVFDPHFHEVMFEAPVPGKAAGIIIQLIEPGYTLHDRLLRPARVGVAKGDPDAPPIVNEEV